MKKTLVMCSLILAMLGLAATAVAWDPRYIETHSHLEGVRGPYYDIDRSSCVAGMRYYEEYDVYYRDYADYEHWGDADTGYIWEDKVEGSEYTVEDRQLIESGYEPCQF